MNEEYNLCVFCKFAKMKKDICGIYCTGGFVNENGQCKMFKEYKKEKKK